MIRPQVERNERKNAQSGRIEPFYLSCRGGDIAQNWKDFEVEWGHYVGATQLVKKMKRENGQPDEAGMLQVASTLCSVMGKDCLKIMNSLPTLT